MLRVSILNGKNKNYDRDFSKILEAIASPGVNTGLDIVDGMLQPGNAFIEIRRAGSDTFYCFVENTTEVAVDVTGTKKVWLEVKQANIDDGTLNAPDGSGIVEVKTGASYPSINFIKIASIVSDVLTDEREFLAIDESKVPFTKGIKSLSDVYNFTNPTVKKFLVFDIVEGKRTIGDVESTDVPQTSSLVIKSEYPLGEPITDITKACVFKETAPTFAQASKTQNIGDDATNTRVSFPAIGTGVEGNSLKLALAKVLSPTAFLRVRLETDNEGNPSGTLVDANATKDIDPSTLVYSSTIVASHGQTLVNMGSYTGWQDSLNIVPSSRITNLIFTKHSSDSAEQCRLTVGGITTTVGFVGNTATFPSTVILESGTTYLLQRSSSSGNIYYKSSFPSYVGTLLTINPISGQNLLSIVSISAERVLDDTTVTFPGSFTVANGTKAHIVVSAVGDVVNASNYYKIGYSTNNTTTRKGSVFDGTIWKQVGQGDVKTTSIITNAPTTSGSNYLYNHSFTITPLSKIIVKKLTFNGDSATLNGQTITSNSEISVILNAGVTYTLNVVKGTGQNGSTYQSALTFTNTAATINWASAGYGNTAVQFSMDSYSYSDLTNSFPYISSTLFHNTVLSLTNSDYSYKSDLYGIATAVGAIGSYPKIILSENGGICTNFTGMTTGQEQFLSGTPGGVSNTAGTNITKVGDSISSNKLNILKNLSALTTIKTAGLSANYSFDSGAILATRDGIITLTTSASGESSDSSATLYIGATSSPTTIVAQAINNKYEHGHIKKGWYYKYVISANGNTTGGSYTVGFMQQ